MRLADYERPGTLRGLHGSHSNTVFFDRPKWLEIVRSVLPYGGWFKIVDTGSAGQKEWARMLRRVGIMPIIRPFFPTCAPVPDAVRAYIAEGITKWIEPWNEPNIDEAWPGRENFAGVGELVEAWLTEAEKIISWGGYPAFPSFAQCGPHPDFSSVKWYELLFAYISDHCRDRARAVFQSGAWIAVHDAVLNRFWKDQEGRYHFEHPYSELVYERIGWRPTLREDDMSLIGHQVPVYLMKKQLGEDIEVPVISTEGGIFAGLIGVQADGAYPAFDEAEHARATVAMYRWLERYQKSYPWYFGMCPWKFAPFGWQHDSWPGDNWIKKGGKKLAVVETVKNMGPPDPDAKPIGPIGLFEEEPMRTDLPRPSDAKIDLPGLIDLRATIQRHPSLQYTRRNLAEIDMLVIHHTGTLRATPEGIARYHVGTRGWPGPGYHVYIRKDGSACWLNCLEVVSYHAYAHNRRSIGIGFEGDFTREEPIEAQVDKGRTLLLAIDGALGRHVGLRTHKSLPQNRTLCPGDPDWESLLMPTSEEVIELKRRIQELEDALNECQGRVSAGRNAMRAARDILNEGLDS